MHATYRQQIPPSTDHVPMNVSLSTHKVPWYGRRTVHSTLPSPCPPSSQEMETYNYFDQLAEVQILHNPAVLTRLKLQTQDHPAAHHVVVEHVSVNHYLARLDRSDASIFEPVSLRLCGRGACGGGILA